jgi:2,5-diamino-6-(ribosylamino)-4(3H)-pyrimidinone 5'-phosphate reductase
MLPEVMIQNAVSLDGRIDWIEPDIGLFYELASFWKEDATLAGSKTIFNPEENYPPEDENMFEPPENDEDDKRPLLVVPDSKGSVRNWHVLRSSGYWRDMVALCSKSTPKNYIKYLENRHIEYIIAGNKTVDLRKALEMLNNKYGVKKVRVDSGGTLNGVLLREDLVNEVSVIVLPVLVGGISSRSFFRGPDLNSEDNVIKLTLTSTEKLKGGVIWLRYKVTR